MQPHPLHTIFADPPREFGIIPFWFWNDDLDEAELLRQIRAFHAKGFGGFIPHARIGLSRRVGYLTAEFFRLVRIAVEEAARLGMKVVLYDEGSYPSGSAQGRVVAENPAYAARCLIALQHPIAGPARGYWHPNPGRALGDELVCVVLGRETAPGVLDPASLTCLDVQAPELVRYEVPEGDWRLIALWSVHSGGTIRGVFAEEDDRHASAPPAGDLLNPQAVDCFLRHTHEQYYAHLKDHFGQTVVAMFTDEPMVLGRDPKRGPDPWPFTSGFLDDVQAQWEADIRCWLPALWLDCGPRSADFRQAYTRAVYERLERVFYGAQSRWCRDHGIALTGHPAESNDFGSLRHFQWPGQDMVWRWVTPGAETALVGPHSCAPKCASSAAGVQGRRRNATEALGAYGWQLTMDEAKWLIDWHLVRGNNLFYLHACFYSIRGRRAFESEPDIGIHNCWWPYFQLLGDYLRRVCWLLTDGREVCDIAILTDPGNAAWTAAKCLYQNQIDFLYIDDAALKDATLEVGGLSIGSHRFRALVCDPPTIAGNELLTAFAAAGGLVLGDWQPDSLIDTLVAVLGRDVDWPAAPDLRVLHYHKDDRHFYFFVNEGEQVLEGDLSLATTGALEYCDPLDGAVRPWPGTTIGGRTHTHLRLERRQGLILAVDPQGEAQPEATPALPGADLIAIAGPWQAWDDDGNRRDLPCPADWSQLSGWETYSGRLCFRTSFTLMADQVNQPLFLDLGQVGDIAEVACNGTTVGSRAWAPYVWALNQACRAGDNQLEVWVTNSMANRLEGLQRPSGLLGPVRIRQIASSPLHAALLATPQDAGAQALAARYAPIVRFDANEPFLPLAAGYTIFHADGPSPSTRRQLALDTPEHPRAARAIEYAIWWDWDIGHLYELEHVWVYLDDQGCVVGCEASWHGQHHSMARDEAITIEGDHVVVYSEPGKHAFAPDPGWFTERWRPHRRAITRELAGCAGVLAPDLFAGAIARTPLGNTLARTYLAQHAFDPAWEFSRTFRFEKSQLVPWLALHDWIPRRVNWWVERLASEIDPASYRPLLIGHRNLPAGALGNTLADIRRAAARGVDMVGADLYITVDGVIVAAHAPFVRDAAGRFWPVGASTLDELRALDLDNGDSFPSLDQICACCHQERVGLYAEIKDGRAIPTALAQLRTCGLAAFTIVGAFRADWVAEAKALAPDIAAAVQFDWPQIDASTLARAARADYLFPCWEARDEQPQARLTAGWVARARDAGLGVIGWHTERPQVRAELQQLGLDAVCGRGPLPAPAAETRLSRRLLAICLDCGDTLADEATEIKDASGATLRAALIPGADELIRELSRRGYRLALVADGYPATFVNVLTQHRIYDYFDAFAISDHLGCLKPERRIFVHALDQLGIRPEEYGRTLMIGNNLARDIKGANALGMISVWLDWAPRRAKIPADDSEIPRYTIKQPLELLQVIEQLEQESV